GTVEREAVNVAIGIRSDGGKEVLDYSIAPTENGAAWSELLQGLRTRGIKDIQLFIADGLVGLQSAIEANYPQAKFQQCWVHAERNLLGYVRKNDRREIITDFKAIRQAENLQAAKERLAAFSAKWESSYKRRIKNLVQMEELFTFFSFPTAIRQTIYSTNLIESFNKSLKKMVRRKEQFPNEGALDRFIMTQVMEYNDKFENRAHRGFKDCHDTLDSMF
ncbi:IS256 family transposase, partial [Limosilactobacillus fermentum]